MKIHRIYRLLLNGEVVYVGRTTLTLKRRFSRGWGKHTEALRDSTIELIEETWDRTRERYWIKYYRDLGCPLYNITDGDGLDRKLKSKLYREENPEYFREYLRNYYRENKCNDKYRESKRKSNEKWLENNPEYRREYYKKNKERLDQINKKYQEENKEKLREYRREYYKRKKEEGERGDNTENNI